MENKSKSRITSTDKEGNGMGIWTRGFTCNSNLLKKEFEANVEKWSNLTHLIGE